jgi:hypothetical protein
LKYNLAHYRLIKSLLKDRYMKKYITIASYLFGFLLLSTTHTSCKTGYGCPAEEAYYNAQDNPQPKSTKRGESNLFGKKRRKKLKERGQ